MPFKVTGAIADAAISVAPLSEGFCSCLREFLSAVLCHEFMSGSASFLVSDVRWMT